MCVLCSIPFSCRFLILARRIASRVTHALFTQGYISVLIISLHSLIWLNCSLFSSAPVLGHFSWRRIFLPRLIGLDLRSSAVWVASSIIHLLFVLLSILSVSPWSLVFRFLVGIFFGCSRGRQSSFVLLSLEGNVFHVASYVGSCISYLYCCDVFMRMFSKHFPYFLIVSWNGVYNDVKVLIDVLNDGSEIYIPPSP